MDDWAELGIPPTADRGAVRRAYATRLKAVAPDSDPQGFARLRQAYERALQAAERAPPGRDPAVPAREPAILPAAPSPFRPPLPGAELAAALRRQDVVAAADWLLAARPSLLLADDIGLTDRLGWAMAQDMALPAEAVRAAADRLGWRQDGVAGAWTKTLRARLDAEQWLATLRRDARSRARFLGGKRSLAGRILLGRGPMRLARTMAKEPMLRQRYGEYLLHAAVVEKQFDPTRIAAIREVLTAKPSKPKAVVYVLLGIGALAWIAGSVAGMIDPQAQAGTTGIIAVGLSVSFLTRVNLRRLQAARQRTAKGGPTRLARLAFWVSLGVTASALAAIAGVVLFTTLFLDAPGATIPAPVARLEAMAVPLAVTAAISLLLSYRFMRRGRNTLAFIMAVLPLALLLLWSIALGSMDGNG